MGWRTGTGCGIVRDSDFSEILDLTPLFSEPYVAVVPASHSCARQKSISPGMLRDESFVYYPRTAGARAFEKPLTKIGGIRLSTAYRAGSVTLVIDPALGRSRAGGICGSRMCAANLFSRRRVPATSECKGSKQHRSCLHEGGFAPNRRAFHADCHRFSNEVKTAGRHRFLGRNQKSRFLY